MDLQIKIDLSVGVECVDYVVVRVSSAAACFSRRHDHKRKGWPFEI